MLPLNLLAINNGPPESPSIDVTGKSNVNKHQTFACVLVRESSTDRVLRDSVSQMFFAAVTFHIYKVLCHL